jgi:hypothetical protein
MLWVTLLTEKDPLKPPKEIELKSKPQELSPENPSTNPCKLDLKPLIVWFLLVEDKENLSLVIDKPVKPLSLLILS